MPDLKKSQRYHAILELVADRPAGCTIRQIAELLQKRFTDQDWSESTVRRDVDDLVAVGWIERIGRNHVVGLVLGNFAIRRFAVAAHRATQPQEELRGMVRALNDIVNPNIEV